jgi:hypothetical protein
LLPLQGRAFFVVAHSIRFAIFNGLAHTRSEIQLLIPVKGPAMKGIVFTEFLEMVENKYSPEVADRIIETSNLSSGGAYTSVGTYDHAEFIQLVTRLSAETKVPVPDLVREFGRYLFTRFHLKYSNFFNHIPGAFAFLARIENYIHVEVRKLYSDAELPRFEIKQTDPQHMELTYKSSRPFADLAEGLILGCIEHFKENIQAKREDISNSPGETSVRFDLVKQS